MEVLSYQTHSGKYSPFAHDGLLPTSSFRTLSSSDPTYLSLIRKIFQMVFHSFEVLAVLGCGVDRV
jgi:hypothetical protein